MNHWRTFFDGRNAVKANFKLERRGESGRIVKNLDIGNVHAAHVVAGFSFLFHVKPRSSSNGNGHLKTI